MSNSGGILKRVRYGRIRGGREVQEAALKWWLEETMVWVGSKPRTPRR